MQFTSRLAIPSPEDADVPDIPAHLLSRATILDKAAITDHGPFSNRPVSTVANPGIKGRRYYAEDHEVEYLDTGTGWKDAAAVLNTLLVKSALTITDSNYFLEAVGPGNLRLNSAGDVIIRLGGVERAWLGSVLRSGGDHIAHDGGTFQTRIGNTSNFPSLAFGNPLDAFLFRIAAARMGVGALNVGASPGSSNGIPVAAGVEELRFIRGRVNQDGTISSGTGFTIEKHPGNAGWYTIHFSVAFPSPPTVVVTSHHNSVNTPTSVNLTTAPTNSSQTIQIRKNVDDSLLDAPFQFIAAGPR